MKTEQVTLPLNECSVTNCLVKVETLSQNYNINATLHSIQYLGSHLDQFTCYYGGLVLTQNIYDERYTDTICQQYNHIDSLKKSFYSTNSSLLILLYWYKNYSKINLTLFISTTHCTAIQLDYCTIDESCSPHKMGTCSLLLNHITRHSDITLRYQGSWSTYFFSFQNPGCVILQFKERYMAVGEIYGRCSINLVATDEPLPGVELSYHIMGNYFGGKLEAMLYLADTTHTEEINILVHPEKHLMDCDIQPSCNGLKTLYDYLIEPQNDTETSFFINSVSKSPIHKSSFSLSVVMPPVTKSWVDIIIQKKLTDHNSHGLRGYLTEYISLSKDTLVTEKVGNSLEYILLVTLDDRIDWNNFSEVYDELIQFSYMSQANNYLQSGIYLKWEWKFPVSNIRDAQLISFVGKVQSISTCLLTKDDNITVPIKFTWIHDNYKKTLNTKGQKCVHYSNESCTFFQNSGINDYILISKYDIKYDIYYFIYGSPKPSFSWEDANKECIENGGFLPHFSSKNDLDRLITLIKLSEDIPPMEAIFIGLRYSERKKVCYLG